MVAVRIELFIVVKTIHNDIRASFADSPDRIGEYFVFIPKTKCFFRIFGKTEVVGSAETLLSTIYRAGHQQFFGAQNTQ